jgi:hypothetical protein
MWALRQCTSGESKCQDEIFLFDLCVGILYNYCIDGKETKMRIADFFADFSDAHYSEFVEAELAKIFQSTTTHDEIFLLDVPF